MVATYKENDETYSGGIMPVYRFKASLTCIIVCLVIDLFIASLWIPISYSETGQMAWLEFIVTCLFVIIIPLILTYIWAIYYARNFTYIVDKKFIRIKYGVIARHRTTIPFSRIQNIAIKQTLLDRILKVSTVAIETAGGSGSGQKGGTIRPEGYIPALKDPTKLESIIDEMVHEYTQDVPDKLRNKIFTDKDMAFDEFIAYIMAKMTEADEMKTKIRELRDEKGWTQNDLADKVGVSRQTISYLETGKYMPSLKLAMKIAHLFDVSVEDIFVLDADEF